MSVDFDNNSCVLTMQEAKELSTKYYCQTVEELEEQMWYGYGVVLTIINQ